MCNPDIDKRNIPDTSQLSVFCYGFSGNADPVPSGYCKKALLQFLVKGIQGIAGYVDVYKRQQYHKG